MSGSSKDLVPVVAAALAAGAMVLGGREEGHWTGGEDVGVGLVAPLTWLVIR